LLSLWVIMMSLDVKIKQMLEAKSPINVQSEIADLDEFIEIYADGRFSDEGETVFFKKKTDQWIIYRWNHWQGEGSFYYPYSLEKYVTEILLPATEDTHFKRAIEGLRKAFQ
jgi:hypothetical protein